MKKTNLDDLMAEMIPAVEEEMRSVLCLENEGTPAPARCSA
jgi:hypothetical protein